jgi:clan AA aspartic protease (TIGR02281 family)
MRLLIAFTLSLCAATANAASLDPSRIATIDQAADAFLAKAAEARKSGTVPRQSDPGIGALLDTVFDTSDLSHGALPYADLDGLQDWLARAAAVGDVYVTASRTVHDAGIFAPEMGRFIDAAVTVMQGVADCLTAESDARAGQALSVPELHKIEQSRTAIAGNIDGFIKALRGPRLTVGWIRDRLTVMTAAAPSFARFLTTAELARLRATAVRMAGEIHDKSVRGALGGLAAAFATPAAPVAAPANADGGAEIALETNGSGDYSVPVRINGALTFKFVVDSGASVVVLPSDLVETLTKSGAIAASDMLGRDVYVTADGRKHKGTRLMLRQLDAGGHTVTNVIASVAPAHAEPLLGLSFLTKFKSWTLDNRRHVLIVTE